MKIGAISIREIAPILFARLSDNWFRSSELHKKKLEQNEKDITMSLTLLFKEDYIMKEAQFSKAFTVALKQEVFEQVKRITDEKRISMAEWVRDAVDVALNNAKQEEVQINDK